MKTDRVEVIGRDVVIRADTEGAAREIAAAADRERVRLEGGFAEKTEAFFDRLGDVIDAGVSRPTMGVLGWALAIVAGVMAFLSFERVAPDPALAFLFGVVGVVFVAVVKVGAARWAKADNLASQKLGNFYRYVVFGGMTVIFAVGVAFQAAVADDVDTGRVELEKAVADMERAIREAEIRAEDMPRPVDEADLLLLDLKRELARPARNVGGADAGFSVGEAVGAGADPENMPDTFCMSNRQRQSYIERYCEDLIDRARLLRQRRNYETALAEIVTARQEVEDKRKTMPQKASSLVVGEKVAQGGDGKIWGYAVAALILAFVEAFMVFCVYISKRHPKGVTRALAALAEGGS